MKKTSSHSLQRNLLLIAVVLLSILAFFTYYQYQKQLEFQRSVTIVAPFGVSKRIVYATDPKKTGNQIYIADKQMDLSSLVEVNAHIGPPEYPILGFVENKEYAVILYGSVEGTFDYLIFDEDGKIITESLIGNNFDITNSGFPNLMSDSAKLGFDGILTMEQDINGQKKLVRFDITTGKLKK